MALSFQKNIRTRCRRMNSWLPYLSLLALFFGASARSDNSCIEDLSKHSLPIPETDDFIKQQFSSGRYECGVQALRREALTRSMSEGLAGWDARFALREFALEIVKSGYPPNEQLNALRAAVSPSLETDVPRRPEDLTADSRTLFNAGEDITDCSEHFELLDLALRINRRLPPSQRDDAIRAQLLELCNSRDSRGIRDIFKGIDALLILEKDTRGDSSFEGWRSSLARDAHFYLGASTPEQAQQALALVEALSDIKACQDCGSDWRWRPTFQVAIFYHGQQMQSEAMTTIQTALGMIRAIPDLNQRFLAFKDVCTRMQLLRYPDQEYLPVIQEIKPLAASLHTSEAAELQTRLETDNCVRAGSWAERRR
jgi:hypothetical protein